jgi:hypothetical protein
LLLWAGGRREGADGGVLGRAVEQIPDKLLPAPTFEKLVAAAARVGVLVEHREAFRSVTIFLENAISLGIVVG